MVIEEARFVFLAGCVGGVLAEVLHWWNLRTKPEFPSYARSPGYWAITAAMVLAGGIICWFYFGDRVDGPVALHIGVSTPILLQKLLTSLPEQTGTRELIEKPRASLKSFFKW